MKKQLTTTMMLIIILPPLIMSQMKTLPEHVANDISKENLRPVTMPSHYHWTNSASRNTEAFKSISSGIGLHPLSEVYVDNNTNPVFISGPAIKMRGDNKHEYAYEALSKFQDILQIEKPKEEFQIVSLNEDELGMTHVLLQQTYKGIPIYGAEVRLHFKENSFRSFNGYSFPTPSIESLDPEISQMQSIDNTIDHVSAYTEVIELDEILLQYIDGPVQQSQLVIFYPVKNVVEPRLAWEVNVKPNLSSNWICIVDANSGEILHSYDRVCRFAGSSREHVCSKSVYSEPPHDTDKDFSAPMDGPAVANAIDLCGVTRQVNTYEVSGNYFLIDGARPMFNNVQSSFPNDVVGGIITLDGQNSSASGNISAIHNVTTNNSWSNRTAVSAHYNAGLAYEYFRTTFNRNSINGSGGNIISLINITENGMDMDNAFWNGAAMFYGNGNVAFNAPLAKSDDIAGHEMSHGVIQTTANLEYFGESGAINESMADVFGAMIDRDDWTLAEDVANPQVFSSGAMRDMSNPHNGGNSLADNGWQPSHTSEQFFGNEDNGGVHINSGIPNHAYYLLAESIGKNKAEQIFYRALTQYLVKSSQFIDLRIAVIQSAKDLHGNNSNEVTQVENAFGAVGIGQGNGTDTQVDIDPNLGDQFVLLSDDNLDALYIFKPDGSAVWNPLTYTGPLSKPSVTDDGTAIVFIAQDNTMKAIFIDWDQLSGEEIVLQPDPIWRNVAVSRDGARIAALTTDNDNSLWIFDFGLNEWSEWELYNPTTGQGGPTTGDVDFADVLEFDFSGEWVMYDAQNRINNAGGDIVYWDIGFIRIFNSDSNNWGDGLISKLYSGLPENTSIGNPTFSKNSDFVIAFDWLDEFNNEFFLVGANIETNDLGVIFNNTVLSYPNYSVEDDRVVFDATAGQFNDPVLAFVPVADDKINNGGNGSVFLDGGKWGVWFANGDRVLTGIGNNDLEQFPLTISPNPAMDYIDLEFKAALQEKGVAVVLDALGNVLLEKHLTVQNGINTIQFDIKKIPSGTYILNLKTESGLGSRIFSKH